MLCRSRRNSFSPLRHCEGAVVLSDLGCGNDGNGVLNSSQNMKNQQTRADLVRLRQSIARIIDLVVEIEDRMRMAKAATIAIHTRDAENKHIPALWKWALKARSEAELELGMRRSASRALSSKQPVKKAAGRKNAASRKKAVLRKNAAPQKKPASAGSAAAKSAAQQRGTAARRKRR